MYPGVLYRTSRNAAHAVHGATRSAHRPAALDTTPIKR
nr:MAG TPA: hypothetical protein [Caudoviricetes sp.]